MKTWIVLIVTAVVVGITAPPPAEACGGFFCGQQPVDQSAERIIFSIDEDAGETDLIVQITYGGKAEDFAWVLPLAAVPAVDSLETFPLLAMRALDTNTGPTFQLPSECWEFYPRIDAAAEAEDGGGDPDAPPPGSVMVHIEAEVGPYEVAVVESDDPAALVTWLRDNEFRITEVMVPYIELYTDEGMKFLALKLNSESDVGDIEPFRLTLPGTASSVPLRMTALAAEPEMGILVTVLGDMRYGSANWPTVEIDVADIRMEPGWNQRTNWTALVARGVDEAGGQGWVTELAEPVASYLELARNTFVSDEEQEEARDALVALLEGETYITRLYTRLSAEEMTSDPVFRRTGGSDVSRVRELTPAACEDWAIDPWGTRSADAAAETVCDFATCGAAGYCVPAQTESGVRAACACAPGATARTTRDPAGNATVICQDQRMSFMNPGDRETPSSTPLPDPCVGFDCGGGSQCVAMNMTPTCVCAPGLAAVGTFDSDGNRTTTCVEPMTEVPESFYNVRLPALPAATPGGRRVDVPEPVATGCAVSEHQAGATVFMVALGLLLLVRRQEH